jgi:hypothetical protein
MVAHVAHCLQALKLLAPRCLRLAAVDTLKRYSKALKYEYRVKTATLDTLKRYCILSLTLYLEWYSAYSILYSVEVVLNSLQDIGRLLTERSGGP